MNFTHNQGKNPIALIEYRQIPLIFLSAWMVLLYVSFDWSWSTTQGKLLVLFILVLYIGLLDWIKIIKLRDVKSSLESMFQKKQKLRKLWATRP
jgi:hypothetical protein